MDVENEAAESGRPNCPVCGTRGQATDWVDLGVDDVGLPVRKPTLFVCPNGHKPSDDQWRNATHHRQAVLRVIRDAIDSPDLHDRDAGWKYDYGDAAEKVLADLEAAGFAIVERAASKPASGESRQDQSL